LCSRLRKENGGSAERGDAGALSIAHCGGNGADFSVRLLQSTATLPMSRRAFLSAAISVWMACPALAGAAPGAVRIDVEFLADGRCAVAAEGERVHANVIYLPPQASGLRCAIPPSPIGKPVDLTVRLPRGAAPGGYDFPRLTWIHQDSGWIGTAALPAAPAFVSVPQSGAATLAWWRQAFAPPTRSTPFGWNFYGWFMFSATFIAVYFVWARRMARRDTARRLP
jgi:hypothetical protein